MTEFIMFLIHSVGRVLFNTLGGYSLQRAYRRMKTAGKFNKKLTNNFIILCELTAKHALAFSHEVEALNKRRGWSFSF
ncbi:hypothetical protein [Rhizobium sp.]|uniref:hypothetical protein n=1 Tax=Rhizobium sp. TaxID=391 RepID=UPI002EE6DECA